MFALHILNKTKVKEGIHNQWKIILVGYEFKNNEIFELYINVEELGEITY